MLLSDLCSLDNKIGRFLNEANRGDPVLLYGAGFAMPAILQKLEDYRFNVVGICDSDPSKQGSSYANTYPIYSLDQATDRHPKATFVISSPAHFDAIYAALVEKLGAKRVSDVDLECSHYFKANEFNDFFRQNLPRFETVLSALADDGSRETFFKVLKAHLSGERRSFQDASTGMEDWYLFRSQLKPNANSIYVDCGAFDGDTIRLFMSAATEGFRGIYAFEPDPAMHDQLRELTDSAGQKRIHVVEKGAFDRQGVVLFHQNGMYSAVVGAGDQGASGVVEIPVTTIDSVLSGEPVDTIKMDIEGAEFEALKGAQRTIKSNKPRLAICVYHRVEDFVRIAERILEFVPDYKLRLRHQSDSCTDTILFASLD